VLRLFFSAIRDQQPRLQANDPGLAPAPAEDLGQATRDLPAKLAAIFTVGHPHQPLPAHQVADQQAVEAHVPARVLEPMSPTRLDDIDSAPGINYIAITGTLVFFQFAGGRDQRSS
jgi:hypothetical protein